MQVMFRKLFEGHRVVVLRVMRAVHEGYRSVASSHEERLPGIGVSVQFGEVASAEFFPFCWIVTEPFPQLRAWSDIFEPTLNLERALLHSSGPQSLDQNRVPSLLLSTSYARSSLNHSRLRYAGWPAAAIPAVAGGVGFATSQRGLRTFICPF